MRTNPAPSKHGPFTAGGSSDNRQMSNAIGHMAKNTSNQVIQDEQHIGIGVNKDKHQKGV